MNLKICSKEIKQKKSIKYLGVLMDSHLNWKDHVYELSKKILTGVGIIFLNKCIIRLFTHSLRMLLWSGETLIKLTYSP